jgi:aminopeptidase N
LPRATGRTSSGRPPIGLRGAGRQSILDPYAHNRDGNVTTADFIALAENVSGQQLDAFFRVWLFDPVKPTNW